MARHLLSIRICSVLKAIAWVAADPELEHFIWGNLSV
jgi:hypothetical protein